MKRKIFYKIFLFFAAVGVIPLMVALVLEYKNIQDLSYNISSLSVVNEEVILEINLIIADTKILILLISFFALILIVLETTVLSRKITSPLYKLIEVAQKIREGKFNVKVNIESGDEFEELGDTFNKMTQDLKESNQALTKALKNSKRSQKIAEEERSKTKMTLDSLTDGLIVLDEKENIDSINPRGEEILGVQESQIKGKKIEELLEFPKMEKLYKILDYKTAKDMLKRELHLEDPVSRIFEVNVISVTGSQKNNKKNTVNKIIVIHDITREKRIERLKNEFISIAAHQLRTPLSAIKWSIEFLEEELREELGDAYEGEIEDYLEKTMKSNERMINLVNDLLNVSRIEEGRFIYNLELISPFALVEEIVEQSQIKARKKDIKIELNKPSSKLPQIRIDKEKVGLAIQNLIDNAIKYSHKNSEVKINLKKIQKKKKEYVKIEIEDEGIGISKKDQEKIFTKFSRGNNAVKSETEGSGLGLFIVKNIIESHQGNVDFESTLNKGSVFYVFIPAAKKNK